MESDDCAVAADPQPVANRAARRIFFNIGGLALYVA